MRTLSAVALVLVFVLTGCSADHHNTVATGTQPAPTGPYLGKQPPGITPKLFYATWLGERDTALTPDGGEIFFSIFERGQGYLLHRVDTPSGWSPPEFAPFSSPGHSELEPFITVDGAWLYFISKRPRPDGGERETFDLWRVAHAADGWGIPDPLPDGVNSEHNEYYPSLTADGDIYFTSDRPDGLGGEDIWVARWNGGGWSEPENLGPPVNSPGPEFNSLIAPDGSWLIFGAVREGDVGGGDLHIAFRGPDGGFLPAINMGEPVNSPRLDYCPALSPDGSVLFFTSNRVADDEPPPSTFAELAAVLDGPANGRDNIWWVSAEIIETLRPTPDEESRPH